MPDRVCQFRPVHRSRHVNVREDNLNVRAAFKDGYGDVGVRSLDDFKSRIPDCFRRRCADQKLVLDYEDDRTLFLRLRAQF
jgi:hypothetical protein